jgi:hypothetical protein
MQARQEDRGREYAALVERAERELEGHLAPYCAAKNALGLLLQLQSRFPEALPGVEKILMAAGSQDTTLLRFLKGARNKFHPDRFRQEISDRKARAEVVFKIISSFL